MAKNTNIQNIDVSANTVIGSTYSQLVGISVTDIDITLEFVFIHPRDKSKGQVVSRVTMPLNVGIDLAQSILTTLKIHEHNRKGVKND